MDLKADEKSVNRFKDKIEGLGLSISAYQLLEVIFRQTLMASTESGYHYAHEAVCEDLHKKVLSPDARIALLRGYIDKWEERTGFEYGFTYVHINEIDPHASLLHEYQEALSSLKEVFARHQKIFNAEIANNQIKKLHEQMKIEFQINGRPLGRYFDEDSLKFRIENFDYFSRYLGFAYGIYDPFFNKLISVGDEERNNFYRFITAKLNFECENNQHLKIKFTAKMLGDRIKNNKKGYEFLGNEPTALGLVDSEFIDHLCENQNRLPAHRASRAS